MISDKKLDELKSVLSLVEPTKLHTLKSNYASILSQSGGYTFSDIADSFNKVYAILVDIQSKPDIWSDVHLMSFDGIVSKIKNIPPQIESLRQVQEANKPTALSQFHSYIQQLHESLSSNNILFKSQNFSDFGEVDRNLVAIKSFVEKLPDFSKQMDGLINQGSLNAITNGFRTRKKAIDDRRNFYFYFLIALIGLSSCFAFYFFVYVTPPVGDDRSDWVKYIGIRLAVFAPFTVGIVFLWKEFGRERELEEEYGFREAISGVMPSLINTLSSEDARLEIGKSTLNHIFAPIKRRKEAMPYEKIMKEVRETLKAVQPNK